MLYLKIRNVLEYDDLTINQQAKFQLKCGSQIFYSELNKLITVKLRCLND